MTPTEDQKREALAWFGPGDPCYYHPSPILKDCATCAAWILAESLRESESQAEALRGELAEAKEANRKICESQSDWKHPYVFRAEKAELDRNTALAAMTAERDRIDSERLEMRENWNAACAKADELRASLAASEARVREVVRNEWLRRISRHKRSMSLASENSALKKDRDHQEQLAQDAYSLTLDMDKKRRDAEARLARQSEQMGRMREAVYKYLESRLDANIAELDELLAPAKPAPEPCAQCHGKGFIDEDEGITVECLKCPPLPSSEER